MFFFSFRSFVWVFIFLFSFRWIYTSLSHRRPPLYLFTQCEWHSISHSYTHFPVRCVIFMSYMHITKHSIHTPLRWYGISKRMANHIIFFLFRLKILGKSYTELLSPHSHVRVIALPFFGICNILPISNETTRQITLAIWHVFYVYKYCISLYCAHKTICPVSQFRFPYTYVWYKHGKCCGHCTVLFIASALLNFHWAPANSFNCTD